MQPAFIIAAIVLLLAPNLAAVPDEPVWSQVFEAMLLLALAIAPTTVTRSSEENNNQKKLTAAPALFVAWIALSLVARIAGHHGSLAYLDVMLRGVTYFASCAALFELGRRASATGRIPALLLLGSMVAGSLVVSGIGINEYLTHLRAGQPLWRVFSLSTPDFLAGYLVIVAPISFALLLAGPRSIATYGGLGLCLALEMSTILTTASRFALVSVAVSLIVFAALCLYSRSKEAGDKQKPKYGIYTAALIVFLGLCLKVGPIRKRLMHPDKNSADFRLWTWRGTIHMIHAHPIFGSGIATYVFTYPVYALTGFTRLAHDAYLQIAAETGIPTLLILIVLFVLAIKTGIRNLIDFSSKRNGTPEDWNPRIIYCGVIAAAIAGLVQNFIDSDFYVFSCGTALFAVLGLCAGMKSEEPAIEPAEEVPQRRRKAAAADVAAAKQAWTPARIAAASICAALCVLACSNAFGAWNASNAAAALGNNDQGAQSTSDYQTAMQACPLNGQYPSDFGYKVTFRMANNPSGAENDLRNAVSLQPDEVSYRRLSEILAAEGKTNLAVEALDSGLRQSPNDLDLLLRRAQMSPPAEALNWYQRAADLETTPVGTVRALDAIEVDFAIADGHLADADLQAGNSQAALLYYKRVVSRLQAYFNAGGGHNFQQMILSGEYDDDREKMLKALLDRCTIQVQALQANTTTPDQKPIP